MSVHWCGVFEKIYCLINGMHLSNHSLIIYGNDYKMPGLKEHIFSLIIWQMQPVTMFYRYMYVQLLHHKKTLLLSLQNWLRKCQYPGLLKLFCLLDTCSRVYVFTAFFLLLVISTSMNEFSRSWCKHICMTMCKIIHMHLSMHESIVKFLLHLIFFFFFFIIWIHKHRLS